MHIKSTEIKVWTVASSNCLNAYVPLCKISLDHQLKRAGLSGLTPYCGPYIPPMCLFNLSCIQDGFSFSHSQQPQASIILKYSITSTKRIAYIVVVKSEIYCNGNLQQISIMVLVSLYLSSEGLKKENVRPCNETLSTMEKQWRRMLFYLLRKEAVEFNSIIISYSLNLSRCLQPHEKVQVTRSWSCNSGSGRREEMR